MANPELVEHSDDLSQLRTVQQLPPDLMLLKMETDQIMTVAATRPRDYKAILAELKAEIECFPASAERAIYNKPVGKDGSGRMQYARGLSIRAAESMRVAMGYNRVSCQLKQLDADTIEITATFIDYRSGTMWSQQGLVSKRYKTKTGGVRFHDDDRFYSLVVPAAQSRLIREVILRSVPSSLKAAFEAHCEEEQDKLLSDATMDKVITSFAAKGITAEHLEAIIGRPRKLGWTTQDRKHLQGLWVALEEEQTTIEEILLQAGLSEDQAREAATGSAGLKDKLKSGTKKPAEKPTKPAADPAPEAPPEPAEAPLADVLAAIEEAQTEAEVREIITSEPFTLLGGVDALKAAQAADDRAAHLKAKAEGKLL